LVTKIGPQRLDRFAATAYQFSLYGNGVRPIDLRIMVILLCCGSNTRTINPASHCVPRPNACGPGKLERARSGSAERGVAGRRVAMAETIDRLVKERRRGRGLANRLYTLVH
jgi:hypothetical protein